MNDSRAAADFSSRDPLCYLDGCEYSVIIYLAHHSGSGLQVQLKSSCLADPGETVEFLGAAGDCKACKRPTASSTARTVASDVPATSVARFSVGVPEATGTDEFGRGGSCVASTCIYAVDDKYASTIPVAAPVATACVDDAAGYCKMCSYESLQVRPIPCPV